MWNGDEREWHGVGGRSYKEWKWNKTEKIEEGERKRERVGRERERKERTGRVTRDGERSGRDLHFPRGIPAAPGLLTYGLILNFHRV